ncbi:solute carrier family 52, riboflavin transporter, member 3-A-like [Culicoides brevitarsis]|uniref:solute carrier family 52, riboflavin transporter, member 3-A-like n=1 Tax=Culicoides brevitarsis TaxID=469753 RepID=UPI00307BF0F4
MPEILSNPLHKRIILHCLSIVFGFSSWMGVNAIFLEVPIIINGAPEGWKLSSYIVLIVQSGNIGVVLYNLLQKFWPIKDAYLIYLMLTLGCVASLLIGFTYDRTVEIGGHARSLPLFVFTFLFALVACTSSVMMMPYMGRFLKQYIITYCMGVGIAGFISSILALVQGSGSTSDECIPSNNTESGFEPVQHPPNFSVKLFFLIHFGFYLLSSAAFLLLANVKSFRTEYAQVSIKDGNDYTFKTENSFSESQTNLNEMPVQRENLKIISASSYRFLMTLTGVLSIICNAVLPSIQSFSTLPYSTATHHYSAIFSLMANPVADIIRLFTPERSVKGITFLVGVLAIPAGYILALALMSPNPPLQNTFMGPVLSIAAWTIYTGLYSFINVSIITIFRQQGGKSLVWNGTTAQVGSFTGAIIFFFLINYTNTFKSFDPCNNHQSL